jgi:hypothetical protein
MESGVDFLCAYFGVRQFQFITFGPDANGSTGKKHVLFGCCG